MLQHNRYTRLLMCGAAAAAISTAGAARAEDKREFRIAPQPLATALMEFGAQSGAAVVVQGELTAAKTTRGLSAEMEPEAALKAVLEGTGLSFRREGELFAIVQAGEGGTSPQAASAVEALIVTAQKREEDIQDVPIAMSAFSQEDLTRSQIAGGPDLMTQVPNLTFTKTNFTSYSIQIRGIGTQAISATVDPAVAVAFNNTPFVHNRFFEQEFYDLERVEVLRGPQGTLYGRNATAGVVNIISAKPKMYYEARLSGDVANYNSTRLEGMVNLPLVEDRVALRIAGAWTKRDGFVTNGITGEQIDGRDLWSARATLRIEPNDYIRANLTYEHFEEDDDRLRSGKQLCTRSPNFVEGATGGAFGINSYTTQGCMMGSLYEADAFQVPNGFALPYYGPLVNAGGLPVEKDLDPYASTVQSRDLRVIESTVEPIYQAKNDTLHFALEIDIGEGLTLASESAYSVDETFGFQDFNRFNTTTGIFDDRFGRTFPLYENGVLPNNEYFCDPQLGCADRLVAADLAKSHSTQFGQEFRLSSDFSGPINFHVGANFLRMDTEIDYYFFANTLTLWSTLLAGYTPDFPWAPGESDNTQCAVSLQTVDPQEPNFHAMKCVYIDPNPIGALNGMGRNYFLSKNPFRLISYAAFGEVQYDLTPTLKLTAGLRFTVDKKHAPIVPSWLLTETFGTSVKRTIEQEWRKPTGRLVLDWKPDFDFTDETLLYASYAHGYKAGGTNPPLPGGYPLGETYADRALSIDVLEAVQPPEFGPEFIDAFEIGSKNTLLGGRVTLNANAFYYDYEGYQISQIVNRSAINLNFDAKVWGAELELDWRPLDNLKLGLKAGYEKTKVADGQTAIDMIDRTAGQAGWVVVKPFPTNPSNCIAPVSLIEDLIAANPGAEGGALSRVCDMYLTGQGLMGFDPDTAPNSGQGFSKELGGNELPNAPDFTTTLSADYTIPLPDEWLLTLHTDLYRQSQAWARIFNEDPYDKIRPYTQINLAAILTNEAAGWNIMAYVKNLEDKDSITGAFLNSDDTALTTNVFLTEPRLYGVRVTKQFTGEPLLGGLAGRGGPPSLWVEAGVGALQMDAPNTAYFPTFEGQFSDTLHPVFVRGQDGDLDWGDGRDVRLTYALPGSRWTVSAAARFGRMNGRDMAEVSEEVAGGWLLYEDFEFPGLCEGDECYVGPPSNYGRTSVAEREDFTVVDFAVGSEAGLGLFGPEASSRLSAGLRYAQFNSRSDLEFQGQPDWYLPWERNLFCEAVPGYACAHVTDYAAQGQARRSFEGAGPVASWEAAIPIAGDDGTGRLMAEWSIGGGVLFGRQQTALEGEETAEYFEFRYAQNGPTSDGPSARNDPQPVAGFPLTLSARRSENVTVPLAGASLGLAYGVERFKISAGYRWERYFDAIDGGITEQKQYDRTIDGPYLKIAVGFGG